MPVLNKTLKEKCGVIAIYTAKPTKQFSLSMIAAGGVQHRGQHGAGIAQYRKNGIIRHIGNGLLKDVFTPSVTKKMDKKSLWTMVHCRYGTYGGYQSCNLQPCFAKSKDENQIVVIHNGEFVATQKMKDKIKGKIADEASDTSLFTKLLSQAEGNSWEEKIAKTLGDVKGAFSLIIGVDDKLYLARDQFGIRPLVFGKINNGWIIASETHALDKIGVKVIREIRAGEIIRIDKNGMKIINPGTDQKRNFCDFEWAYFSKPNSILPTQENNEDYKKPENWLSIVSFRERCGHQLAKESPIKNATFVVGVPDSGVYLAMGYANTLKLPYRQVIVRDHFDRNGSQRLFMRDDQKDLIKSKVLGKLSLVPEKNIWKDAIVVVGDDSVVRGNVIKKIVKAIFNLGAKEIHVIVGFPPVRHRCFLGVSMRTHEELIAYNHNGDAKKIAQDIGATSINYISPKAFLLSKFNSKQLNIPANLNEIYLRNGSCGGCLTGLYPVNQNGEVYQKEKTLEKIKPKFPQPSTGIWISTTSPQLSK